MVGWNIPHAALVVSATLVAVVYLVAVSGMLSILPVACGIVFSRSMLHGVENAKPSTRNRILSPITSVLVYTTLTLIILVPSIFIGVHAGFLAFVTSAWVTILTIGATYHFRLRKI